MTTDSTSNLAGSGNSTQDPAAYVSATRERGDWWRDPEKSEADKHLEATRNLLAAREKEEEIQLRKMTGQTVPLEHRKPKDILRSVVALSRDNQGENRATNRMRRFSAEGADGF